MTENGHFTRLLGVTAPQHGADPEPSVRRPARAPGPPEGWVGVGIDEAYVARLVAALQLDDSVWLDVEVTPELITLLTQHLRTRLPSGLARAIRRAIDAEVSDWIFAAALTLGAFGNDWWSTEPPSDQD